MSLNGKSKIPDVLTRDEPELLSAWVAEQVAVGLDRGTDLRGACVEFLGKLREAARLGRFEDVQGAEWGDLHDMIAGLSRARALQGFTPTETATFVFSFKKPLFERLREAHADDPRGLADDLWRSTVLLDKLGLWTTEVQQQGREEVIARQHQEMLELSTPVVKLWEGILALPMIGTLDSSRTQVVMESLLKKIVETGSQFAIIDITGVPVVDTLVAQHLLKTVTAARLMGADCIISGIRPQIAQTIVHLGVDLAGVTTKATLADALALAMHRSGLKVVKIPERA
jgi:rsbT co-antagonist protein RsbR